LHLRSFYHHLVDRVEGIDTAGDIWQTGPGFNTDIARKYGPGGWWDLRMTIGKNISPEDVFIDFGSGKGRMVYLAARYYPFKKVIGVEISDNLNLIAKKNLDKHKNKLRCRDVEIITTNISEYVIPDNITLVYLYDPFREALFVDLIKRLRTSLTQYPRSMRIIYRNPVMHKSIIDAGFQVAMQKRSLIMYKNPGR
jgi:SAM-dependent methyltransferase